MSDAYQQAIAAMGRDVYDRMLTALEQGRWPDGQALTEAQRQHCMQAVIAWGEYHLSPDERVGFIDKGAKASAAGDEQPLRWGVSEE